MKKYAAFATAGALLLAAAGMIGCAEDDDGGPTGTQVTTAQYRGSLFDPVLDSVFAVPPVIVSYDSSWYVYTISSDGNYQVGMTFGMPLATIEEGGWTLAGSTYTFTPTAGWRSAGMTLTPIPTAELPGPYTGAVTGNAIMFSNYTDVMYLRPLGPLTVYLQ